MIEIIDFGVKEYGEILKYQEILFNRLIEEKKNLGKAEKEYVLIGEHLPVITMGRRAKRENLLVSEEYLARNNVGLFQVGRGGDFTYHCLGQMVVYPILDLEKHGLGVKTYVELLEETVIRWLTKYGIKGERIDGATGVWIDSGANERKICAIGVKCSRYCSMHGLSLNVNADLRGFTLINPCGFQDKGVTSFIKEVGKDIEISIEKAKEEILDIFLGLIFPFKEVLDFSK